MDDFLKIIISPELIYPDEILKISNLLEDQYHYYHLRKPTWSEIELENFIKKIPAKYYPQISLHQHHNLAERYNLGGIHLPERLRNKPLPIKVPPKIRLSTSIHELSLSPKSEFNHYSYIFISPVYKSISKVEYFPKFTISQFKTFIQATALPLIALGGVTPANIPELKSAGFKGVALSGSIFT